MLTTLLILGVSAVLFVQGRIRSDIVALCSLLCLIVFGILSPEQALSGFSNSIVVMMVGLSWWGEPFSGRDWPRCWAAGS